MQTIQNVPVAKVIKTVHFTVQYPELRLCLKQNREEKICSHVFGKYLSRSSINAPFQQNTIPVDQLISNRCVSPQLKNWLLTGGNKVLVAVMLTFILKTEQQLPVLEPAWAVLEAYYTELLKW